MLVFTLAYPPPPPIKKKHLEKITVNNRTKMIRVTALLSLISSTWGVWIVVYRDTRTKHTKYIGRTLYEQSMVQLIGFISMCVQSWWEISSFHVSILIVLEEAFSCGALQEGYSHTVTRYIGNEYVTSDRVTSWNPWLVSGPEVFISILHKSIPITKVTFVYLWYFLRCYIFTFLLWVPHIRVISSLQFRECPSGGCSIRRIIASIISGDLIKRFKKLELRLRWISIVI